VKEHRDERCSPLKSSSSETSLLLEEREQAEVEKDSATEREDDEFNSHEEGELETAKGSERRSVSRCGRG